MFHFELNYSQKYVLMGVACLFNLALLAMGIAVMVIVNKADKLAAIDFTNLEQIKTDWDTRPFIQF
jgi:hypothetical protein